MSKAICEDTSTAVRPATDARAQTRSAVRTPSAVTSAGPRPRATALLRTSMTAGPGMMTRTTDSAANPSIDDMSALSPRHQLVEGPMAALNDLWNDTVTPVTDGELEHQEDLGRREHCRPL